MGRTPAAEAQKARPRGAAIFPLVLIFGRTGQGLFYIFPDPPKFPSTKIAG